MGPGKGNLQGERLGERQEESERGACKAGTGVRTELRRRAADILPQASGFRRPVADVVPQASGFRRPVADVAPRALVVRRCVCDV